MDVAATGDPGQPRPPALGRKRQQRDQMEPGRKLQLPAPHPAAALEVLEGGGAEEEANARPGFARRLEDLFRAAPLQGPLRGGAHVGHRRERRHHQRHRRDRLPRGPVGLTPGPMDLDSLRLTVYRSFADRGVAPSPSELATALDQPRDAVVAGPPLGSEGELIPTIRGDGELTEQVSTIDAADLLVGRVAVVFAILEQESGDAGQYGYSGSPDGPMPPIPARPAPEQEQDQDAGEPGGEEPAGDGAASADGGSDDSEEGEG